MKIYDKDKRNIIANADLNKGYLVADKLFVKHHEAIPAIAGQGHRETIREYPNGSKDVQWVWDTEPVPAVAAYDEYEDIQVFIPYTDEEKQKVYKQRVIAYIRKKYDIDDEIALTNDKDSKPQEYAEYQTYREACKSLAKKELGL